MTSAEGKKLLRSKIRGMEKKLTAEERTKSDQLITQHIMSLPEYESAKCLFYFVGTAREIDTTAILQDALHRGIKVCVPLCTEPGIMELRQIRNFTELRPGAYGIPEPVSDTVRVNPAEVELSIIPCVSCDHLGHRLGQGGGYYDRFFQDGTENCILLCREKLVHTPIPCEIHDAVFPVVVTDIGVYRCGEYICGVPYTE